MSSPAGNTEDFLSFTLLHTSFEECTHCQKSLNITLSWFLSFECGGAGAFVKKIEPGSTAAETANCKPQICSSWNPL